MKTNLTIAFLVPLLFMHSGCGRTKKLSPERIGEGQLRYEVFVIESYELQFIPTVVENAMPMSSGETYAIVQLKEINGKNIQQAFGLSEIVITSGVNIEKYPIGEMADYGEESPILEGVARDITNVKFPLDKMTLKFYNLVTGQEYSVDAKKIYSTVAY